MRTIKYTGACNTNTQEELDILRTITYSLDAFESPENYLADFEQEELAASFQFDEPYSQKIARYKKLERKLADTLEDIDWLERVQRQHLSFEWNFFSTSLAQQEKGSLKKMHGLVESIVSGISEAIDNRLGVFIPFTCFEEQELHALISLYRFSLLWPQLVQNPTVGNLSISQLVAYTNKRVKYSIIRLARLICGRLKRDIRQGFRSIIRQFKRMDDNSGADDLFLIKIKNNFHQHLNYKTYERLFAPVTTGNPIFRAK